MLHARHNDAPRRGQAGNADRTFDASKQSPSYYSLNTALLSLLQKQLTPSFYFLLSTLFNYTVRLMAPGMRVCKKKKITSARLNNYSPLFFQPPPATTIINTSLQIRKKETKTRQAEIHCVRLRLNCYLSFLWLSSNPIWQINLGLLTLPSMGQYYTF